MARRLHERAACLPFLQLLAREKAPNGTGTLGDLLTGQVVKEFIKPATLASKTNFVDSLCRGALVPKFALSWCADGTLSQDALAAAAAPPQPPPAPTAEPSTLGTAPAAASNGNGSSSSSSAAKKAGNEDQPGASPEATGPGHPAFGPVSFFVSHAWAYRFGELVALLESHYASLLDTHGGRTQAPVYYWIDALAVTQHHVGEFKEHPDGDFPGVIRASKGLLFTMHPCRSPIAPTRIWCLVEALTAAHAPGVSVELLLDASAAHDANPQPLLTLASSVNVRTASASVASDRSYLLASIERGVGVEAANAELRKLLKAALLQTLLRTAVAGAHGPAGSGHAALVELLRLTAASLPGSRLDVPALMPYAGPGVVTDLLAALTPAQAPRELVLSGREPSTHFDAAPGAPLPQSGEPVWSWLPLGNTELGVLGAMLQRMGTTAAAAANGTATGRAGVAGRASPARTAPAGRAPVSNGGAAAAAGLRSTGGGGSSASGSGASVASASAGRASPTRAHAAAAARGGLGGVVGVGVGGAKPLAVGGAAARAASGPASVAASRTSPARRGARDSGGAAAAGGGGGGGGKGVQALWVRVGQASPAIKHRPLWACAGHATAEEAGFHTNWRLLDRAIRDYCGKTNRTLPNLAFLDPSRDSHNPEADKRQRSEWVARLLDAAALEAAGEPAAREEAAREAAAARAVFWVGVGACSTLRSLVLHRGWLSTDDLARLRAALRATRVLRALHVVEVEAEDVEGGCAGLTAGLLVAALSSSTLETLVITPPALALVDNLDAPGAGVGGGSGGGGGGGGSGGVGVWGPRGPGGGDKLQEFVLAPIALGPAAVRQVADALAAMPHLRAGAVDALKAPPPEPLPAAGPEELASTGDAGARPFTRVPGEAFKHYKPPAAAAEVAALGPVMQMLPPAPPVVAHPPAPARAGGGAGGAHSSGAGAHPSPAALAALQPRAAALTHWLAAVAVGPSAVAAAGDTVDRDPGLDGALARCRMGYGGLAEAALKTAPREYKTTWQRLAPPARLTGGDADGAGRSTPPEA